jgi:hypothetical protein
MKIQKVQFFEDFIEFFSKMKKPGEITYHHPGGYDRALSRRVVVGAWFSRVPIEKMVKRCLWLKFQLTNLMATSSFVLMLVPILRTRYV